VGGVPPAHDANGAQLADELVEAESGTYHALPKPTFDRSIIEDVL
jgi:hypothetical protein